MLRQAFATMLSGRPGPVHLDVPLNVFVEETDAPLPDPGAWRGGVSAARRRRTRTTSSAAWTCCWAPSAR